MSKKSAIYLFGAISLTLTLAFFMDRVIIIFSRHPGPIKGECYMDKGSRQIIKITEVGKYGVFFKYWGLSEEYVPFDDFYPNVVRVDCFEGNKK